MIQRNREMTYPNAIADIHQHVSLRRNHLVHAAASNEHNCTRWRTNYTGYARNGSAVEQKYQ